ncbi:hypothetical protein BDA99DRAFT_487712 [Phascolomyces articulosus]|uniref:Uncharacterized protein n=1 Tax=Phascolomyces articulosus TaxID=60185 RepID=A0AAD5JR07_9FUNG|nr:hypothetical protein BDA99DRAFT_487712 [Phascolomyces articulosus]
MNDEDVKKRCLSFWKTLDPPKRSAILLKKELETKILPDLLGTTRNVSERTIISHFHDRGYGYQRYTKNIYYDGHERSDVQENRIEEPVLNEFQKEHALCTHDEPTFYSNDSKNDIWLADSESVLRKKGPGGSIMVSDFLCPCHEPLKMTAADRSKHGLPDNFPLQARVFFKAGKNKEGWWTNEDMLKQLEAAIVIFKIIHPKCIGVFAFDQSSNHSAYPNDALVASRMTLHDKKEPELVYPFKRRGYTYDSDGFIVPQNFYYEQGYRTRDGKRYKVSFMNGVKESTVLFFVFVFDVFSSSDYYPLPIVAVFFINYKSHRRIGLN